jgi:hypothetical protein
MTRSLLGYAGTCRECGCFGHLWTGDGPEGLCDGCHTIRRVRADYASDPDLARRVYRAADAEAALRLLGVPAE